jgi:protein farnesyltransferase subunit beta
VLFPCAAGTGEQQQQEAWAGSGPAEPAPNPLFNTHALQCWILRVCQQLKGGLRDKPGKPADYYHSCYCLSGLAVAQHIPGSDVLGPALPGAGDGDVPAGVQRSRGNELVRADPVLNVVVDRLRDAQAYFGGGGAA